MTASAGSRADVAVELVGLEVGLRGTDATIVDEVDLRLHYGELCALVGESGSGKTTVALGLLGYARPGAFVRSGTLEIAGKSTKGGVVEVGFQARGRLITYVPQNPASALNPSMRVGNQVAEAMRIGRGRITRDELRRTFAETSLPDDDLFLHRYPHQLSGGQQQRVAIAMALAPRPAAMVLDEPTTALDVVTQRQIMELIRRLCSDSSTAFLYITHNLALASELASRIAVMYAGRVVEDGPADDVIGCGRHPYSRRLVAAVPDVSVGRLPLGIGGVAPGVFDRARGCSFGPRCEFRTSRCELEPPTEAVGQTHHVRCFEWRRLPDVGQVEVSHRHHRPRREGVLTVLGLTASYGATAVPALDQVELEVREGESVAVVGESGSGKTTLARCIVGLHRPESGEIVLRGTKLAAMARKRTVGERRDLQMIFQLPDESLNPRCTVSQILARPARKLAGLNRDETRTAIDEMLERVRLGRALGARYPRDLSGGERQRVSIARALIARPTVLICDEITSALDVSVQAAILNLLDDLRRDLGLALVFISHDLAIVAAVADRVVVLRNGHVVERGHTESLVRSPVDQYTRELLTSIPRLGRSSTELRSRSL